MNVILHIGMPKAGSSALQSALASLRKQLRSYGVLYPAAGTGQVAHRFLSHGLMPTERWLRHLYGGDEEAICRDRDTWFEWLENRVRDLRPQTVVLSEESLFKIDRSDSLAELRGRLVGFADSIDAVAYVRAPSDQYLSGVQQVLKGSHRLRQPAVRRYRPLLEGYAGRVANKMHVFRYERSDFPEGEIARHFLQHFVPHADSLSVPSRDVNASVSAEGMALMQEFRRTNFPEQDGRFPPEALRFNRALRAVDVSVDGHRRPRLYDHVRQAIDQRSEDLVWLRAAYGIEFDGFDYDQIGRRDICLPTVENVSDLCHVDEKRRAALEAAVLDHLNDGGARMA